jgi:cleavage stimulation factor subunit 2
VILVDASSSSYLMLFLCPFEVGNIPYDATEEQLIEIFQEVGPVVSFRLVFDRETGKPKGYGFCEYKDADTALSAMRNLNGYEMNGRALRVDFAENARAAGSDLARAGKDKEASREAGTRDKEKEAPPQTSASVGTMSFLGPLGNLQSEVSKVVDSMSPNQLYEVMVQMKALIQSNPEQARMLLLENPQLAFALLQAQIILGMINPQTAKQLLGSATAGMTQPPTMTMPSNVPPPPPSGMIPGIGPTPPSIPAQFVSAGVAFPPHAPPGFQPIPPTPPISVSGFQPPMQIQAIPVTINPQPQPPPPPPTPQIPSLESLPPEQQQLLQQITKLTPQQIESLPPVQRQQVHAFLELIRRMNQPRV